MFCSSAASLGDFRAIDSSSTGILLEITYVDKMHNIGIRARLPMSTFYTRSVFMHNNAIRKDPRSIYFPRPICYPFSHCYAFPSLSIVTESIFITSPDLFQIGYTLVLRNRIGVQRSSFFFHFYPSVYIPYYINFMIFR